MTLDNVHKRLLDTLKTGVVLLDQELCLLYMNIAAEALLDISHRKAKGSFIGAVLIDAEDDIQEMRNALSNDNSYTMRRADLRLINGKSLVVDYTINPFEENGETHALLEISSLEHANRINREESLHHARETTRELVRGMAHEIKNPLGGIRGAAQLLAREINGDDLTDYTNVIIEEADRLHNLVDRMLGSRKPLEINDTNIHEVLERVRSLVDADEGMGKVNVTKDYDPSIPPLKGDREQLIQAMLNLLRNAVQSINDSEMDELEGKILLRTRILRNVTIGSKFRRLAVSVEIIDNGPGIPPGLMETMFYPMISGRPDGSGLGLPITHSIISQHKGLIECDSEPGNTRFSVTLPIDVEIEGN